LAGAGAAATGSSGIAASSASVIRHRIRHVRHPDGLELHADAAGFAELWPLALDEEGGRLRGCRFELLDLTGPEARGLTTIEPTHP